MKFRQRISFIGRVYLEISILKNFKIFKKNADTIAAATVAVSADDENVAAIGDNNNNNHNDEDNNEDENDDNNVKFTRSKTRMRFKANWYLKAI